MKLDSVIPAVRVPVEVREKLERLAEKDTRNLASFIRKKLIEVTQDSAPRSKKVR